MLNASMVYQDQLTDNNPFSPFGDLKDTYTTKIKTIVTKQKSNINDRIEGVLFLAENLKQEVMNGTRKQQKKKVKQLKELFVQFVTIATVTGMLSLGMIIEPDIASANSLMATASESATVDITPDKIMEWGMKLALILVAVGFSLSTVLYIISGMYRMITRKREEANEWNTDIIKGLVQVLVSIPLIYALFQLSQIIFKNLPFLEGLM